MEGFAGVNTIKNVYPLVLLGKKKKMKHFRIPLTASRITHALQLIMLKLVTCKELVSCEHKIVRIYIVATKGSEGSLGVEKLAHVNIFQRIDLILGPC